MKEEFNQADADVERVAAAIKMLQEHFDTVQIFTTRYEDGGEGNTVHVQKGNGNWFARLGSVRYWLIKQDEASRLELRDDKKDEG